MLEWLKRHAWKACKRLKRFGGSNPPLSANKSVNLLIVSKFTLFLLRWWDRNRTVILGILSPLGLYVLPKCLQIKKHMFSSINAESVT